MLDNLEKNSQYEDRDGYNIDISHQSDIRIDRFFAVFFVKRIH